MTKTKTRMEARYDAELPLVTEPEMAARLAIHPDTIRDARKRGEVPYVQIGRAVRYDPDAVLSALRKLYGAPEPEAEPPRKPASRSSKSA